MYSCSISEPLGSGPPTGPANYTASSKLSRVIPTSSSHSREIYVYLAHVGLLEYLDTVMSTSPWPPDCVFVSRWGRIKLVPPKDEDDPDIVALRNDPETRKYLPFMPADLTVEQWRQRRGERFGSRDNWDLNIHFTSEKPPNGIRVNDTDKLEQLETSTSMSSSFVGVCGIFRIDGTNKTGDVGILIRPDLYRNFIATEALYCNLVLAFEYPQLELYRVSFITGATNVRMRNWLERFGIALEYRKKEAWSDGQGGRLDVVVYTILRPDWSALKSRLKEELDKRLLKG